MQLRPHQQAAVNAINSSIANGHYPAAQLATGTGKSLIIAELASMCDRFNRRVWVLTHSQELVKQNSETYFHYTKTRAGIICAGLQQNDYESPVMFGTIQSVIGPALRGELKTPDLIIVDEAHRVSHRHGETSMYGDVFTRFKNAARVAMTATPWRVDDGLIYGEGKNFWFDERCFKYTVPQAVADGWLSPLVGVETEVQLNLDGVVPGSSDYSSDETGALETNEWLERVAQALTKMAANRKHIAVYCPNVVSAMRAAAVIAQVTGWTTDMLSGNTHRDDRVDMLARFKSGETRVLCSVDTLTTGFDFPALDCIVCLRPTVSSALWVQIQGRGTRLHHSKKNCLLLDFVGNLQRLGGVDMVETYVRERNGEVLETLAADAPKPKAPRRVLPGVTTLIPLDPMTGEQAIDGAEMTVQVHEVSAAVIPNRRNPLRPFLLVNYICTTPENARVSGSKILTTDGPKSGSRYDEVFLFISNRNMPVTLPCPASSMSWAVKNSRKPQTVTVKKSGKYWNVIAEQF